MAEKTEPERDPSPEGAQELLGFLREQDTRERVFEAYPDAVLVLDPADTVLDMNRAAAELLGRTRDERVELHEVLVDAGREGLGDSFGGEWHGRVEVRRADGSTAGVEARSIVVPAESETLRLLVLSQDLGEAERRGWDETRRVEERITHLQAITDAALVHLSLDQLFEELLGRLRDLLHADSVTVLLLDPVARVLRIRATSGLERDAEERVEVPLGVGVAGRIASQKRPAVIGDLGRAGAVSPFLGRRLRSLVGVPILRAGEVRGVLHAGTLRPRRFTQEDVSMLELVAARLEPAIENASLHETERAARAAAEQDAARLRLMQSVGGALAAVLPVDEIGRVVLDRVVPALGAIAGGVGVVDDDGRTVQIAASIGYDAETMKRLASFPVDGDLPAAVAIRDRRIVLIGSPEERDRSFPSLAGQRSVGQSWAALPLLVGSRRVGVITLSFPEPKPFGEEDVEVMSALAHQCAQALDRSRLYETERASRARSEATNRQLRLLQSLTAKYSRALSSSEVAEVSVSEATASLGANSGVVLLLDEDGMLQMGASQGYSKRALEGWQSFPADLPTPAGEAIRTGKVVVVESPADLAERFPLVARSYTGQPIGPTVALPILVDERPIGALAFTFDEGHRLGEDDPLLFQALGRQCGQALERARLYETERRARREAELARERTERLQTVANALASAETQQDVAEVLAEQSIVALGGIASVVVRVRPEGALEVAAARGYPLEVIESWHPLDLRTPSPLAEAIRSGVGIWMRSGAELADAFPAIVETRERLGFGGAFAAIPLAAADQVVGSVGVRFADQRDWPESDREFLRAIARQCTQALLQADAREVELATRRELELSERRYRSLVQTTSTIDWTVDPAGAFVEPQSSWTAYTGQVWERHRGLGWLDAVHEEDREEVMERWFRARDAGELYSVRARVWHEPSGGHRHVVIHAAPVLDSSGRIAEWVGTATDVHEQRLATMEAARREAAARADLETAGERLAYLAAASNVLASSLEEPETLQGLAELAVPRLADWCTIELLGQDGSIELVAVAHVDPAKVELARDIRRRYPTDPDSEVGAPQVLRTGQPFLMEEIPKELIEEAKQRMPELVELLDELQLRSMMLVPLSVGDRVLGVMTFVWAESGFRYDRDDLALAEDLGHRAAVAIENARLYQAERDARREEARASERLRILSEAGAAMAETLDARRMLSALVRTTSRGFSDYCSVYRLDRTGSVMDVVTAHRDLALDGVLRRAATLRLPEPDDEGSVVARVLRTGQSTWEPDLPRTFMDEVTATDEQRRLGRRLQPRSAIAVPLVWRGQVLGIMGLVRVEGSSPFVREDLDLANELGRRAGSLLENARLYGERELIADTLQRSLLPPELPDVPGLEVGARYRPAAPGTTVGGDFYDVFEVDLDNWAVLIGDVVGKGPQAAAMMGLARYTIRTAAMSESRPSALLETLNEAILRQVRDNMFCTACFARVRRDGTSARVTIASGGHPLPLLLHPDGRVETAGEPGTLLGVFEDPTIVDHALDLAPGDVLVMYTDGVVDERRGDEEFGEERLRELLSTLGQANAQGIADAIDRAVLDFRAGDQKDDVAVLVLKVPS
ncbi:MAG: GAF domain-containing protein [Actinomycetota bacterium]